MKFTFDHMLCTGIILSFVLRWLVPLLTSRKVAGSIPDVIGFFN
jgi:hypothetical protein